MNGNKYCCVWGCYNTSRNNASLSFFTLPTNKERRNNWLQLISRQELANKNHSSYVVCEIHFDLQFIVQNPKHKNLSRRALPSLHLPRKGQPQLEEHPQQTQHKEIQVNIFRFSTANVSTQTEEIHPRLSASSPRQGQLQHELSQYYNKENLNDTENSDIDIIKDESETFDYHNIKSELDTFDYHNIKYKSETFDVDYINDINGDNQEINNEDILYSDVESVMGHEEILTFAAMDDAFTCRICLMYNTKLFHIEFSYLKKYYFEIMTPEKPSNEYLPNYVCYECAALLHKWHQFRKQCRFTAKALKKMHETDKLSMERLKEFDRIKYNLDAKLNLVDSLSNVKYIEITYNEGEVIESNPCDDVKCEVLLDHDNQDIDVSSANDDIENSYDDFTWQLNEAESMKEKTTNNLTNKLTESGNWVIEPISEETAIALFSTLDVNKEENGAHAKSLNEDDKSCSNCHICQMSFSQKYLSTHIKKKHSKKYQCTKCTYVCTDLFNAQKHNRIHTPKEYFLCHYCGINVKTTIRKSHIATHRPHPCVYCGIDTLCNKSLITHIGSHHSDQVGAYQECLDSNTGVLCQDCNVTFISHVVYNKHIAESERHSIENGTWKIRKYNCKECGALFYNSRNLKRHKCNELNEKTRCNVCKEMVTGNQLKVHRRQHAKPPRYSCPVCEKKFTFRALLTKHSEIHGIEPLKCEQCVCVFKSKGALRSHMKLQHNKLYAGRPFKCSHCHISYTLFGYLRAHVNKYHGNVYDVKPFKCKQCVCDFTSKMALKRHVVLYHGKEQAKRPFKCSECAISFAKYGYLRAHNNTYHKDIHDAKPYKCEQCACAFKLSKSLNRHIEFHHNADPDERPFKCSQCNICFTQLGYLRLHVNTYHDKVKTLFKYTDCGKAYTYINNIV